METARILGVAYFYGSDGGMFRVFGAAQFRRCCRLVRIIYASLFRQKQAVKKANEKKSSKKINT